MKRIVILTLILLMSATVSGQVKKATPNRPPSKSLETLQTAASLIRYGYETRSATALVEGARMVAAVSPRRAMPGELGGDEEETGPVEHFALNFEPEVLLADARQLAGDNATVLQLIRELEQELEMGTLRGAVDGPVYLTSTVKKGLTKDFKITFKVDELAEVKMTSMECIDLDLFIYDEFGHLVSCDVGCAEESSCSWVPVWTGTYTVRVYNADYSDQLFYLMTN